MAGVTDLPFRLLCKEKGAGLVCMEMVSAKAIMHRNRNTEALLDIHEEEGPASLQLFGNDPQILSEMAKRIEERPFAVLDINMGCPVPKVVNNGEGSALMKHPALVAEIVEACVKAIKKPVTIKIRKGFDEAHVNAAEIAYIAQESGASAVTVHGRTREQFYEGRADWDIIRTQRSHISALFKPGIFIFKMIHNTFQKSSAVCHLSRFYPDRSRILLNLLRHFLLICINTNSDYHMINIIRFSRHFCQYTHYLFPMKQNIIRPFYLCLYLTAFINRF